MQKKIILVLAISVITFFSNKSNAQIQGFDMLNAPVDVSPAFRDFTNTYYFAERISDFDPKTGTGKINYKRYEYFTRVAFNNMLGIFKPVVANEFPTTEYEESPTLPFSIQFISARAIRIKALTGLNLAPKEKSLMLVNGEAPTDISSWKYTREGTAHKYTSAYGSVIIRDGVFQIELYDAKGKLLTKTIRHADNVDSTFTPVLPFSFVRRASDYSRSVSAAFALSPNEKIFGCGESYQEFNKRGQRVVLSTDDANGIQNETMYKPIPFFMSNRGYGMFMHTSTPITCDFGKYFSGVNSLMIGDDELDLFVFLGEPKDILDEYTNLTGKAPMPPLWSFGLWMSRITYDKQDDGYRVTGLLRKNKIPADVLHFDTGWFGVDWRCDYKFSSTRFSDPAKMISDLKKDGMHISLWQLPYFTPKNDYFKELVDKNLVVKNGKGNIPYEDAVLDFSNPATVQWYQDKLGALLKMGVGAIKVDFGEAAPQNGIYYSGRTGFYEHNLYPLRYNKAVADITNQVQGQGVIWARSAWAGSQRYPLHWGGDPANTNTAMAASLRGGLSFGLSGFSFWSHDIGGFVQAKPVGVYKRWTPFGMLASHTRCHGVPPTEPWEYGQEFMDGFRKADEMRYKLMPYIFAQSKQCSEKGLPMVRALFIEYPNDPGAWLVDNEYLFGSDMLVAPLFEEVSERDVYLPAGQWIDYQTGKVYDGGWQRIKAGEIPVVVLVKEGSVIPHIALAQSTMQMDWSKLDLVAYTTKGEASGYVCLPENLKLEKVSVKKAGEKLSLSADPFGGKVKFNVMPYQERK
jgi:alpha-D-xyloside xylohydrolase